MPGVSAKSSWVECQSPVWDVFEVLGLELSPLQLSMGSAAEHGISS